MKLMVQIPCLNEEKTLPITLKSIPRKIEGVDKVEILIIDDGSTDRTLEVAKEAGVEHIVRLTKTKGLAKSFMAGIDASLKLGADIIVNTDADSQYRGEDIPKLIKPILEGKADVVIGNRDMEDFSFTKRSLQRIGSWVVRQVSKTNVPDTTSGFRAYNREAALRLNVISDFTYTLETIIQAGNKDITLDYISIQTNKSLRNSRLFSSTWEYLKRSFFTIIRIYTMYQPLKVFTWVGGILSFMGFLLILRFLYFYFTIPGPTGHTQSLVISAILIIIGFQILMIGLVADLISANRKLIEDGLFRIKKLELSLKSEARQKDPLLK
jgi:glycosyltransferase involved in cell wall biosynthesis